MCASSVADIDAKVPQPRASLLLVMVAMAAIGHCQYTWTLFVPSLAGQLHASLAQVQVGFSLFVTVQTSSVLGLGVLVPRRLHQRCMCGGALLIGVALCGLSAAYQLAQLYVCW